MITERLIDWTERGWIPDALVRMGIRRLLKKRLAAEDAGSETANENRLQALMEELSAGPLAELPEKANEQHYEVPAELFRLTLGPQLKYSCCHWPAGVVDLADAENAALQVTCERAQLANGQRILELGCGWGSLTLWMAKRYPDAQITAVSNSVSQREFILERAAERGIDRNLTVLTCDINDLQLDESFDRIVSVEMFEHVRNHRLLFERTASWLAAGGKLFAHVFCHRNLAYKFEDEGSDDWMSRYFFSGGIMPSFDLFTRYDQDLQLQQQWQWNGRDYQRTSDAWLANMESNRDAIMQVLRKTYGATDAVRWFNRWRMFYLACSELFGFNGGTEWFVGHYLFEPAVVRQQSQPLTSSGVGDH